MRIEQVTRYAPDAQREERGQTVHIPASLQQRKGSYNRITRTIMVKGSCVVIPGYLTVTYERKESTGIPAEFGTVAYQGKRYAAVRQQGDTHWEAVEAEPTHERRAHL